MLNRILYGVIAGQQPFSSGPVPGPTPTILWAYSDGVSKSERFKSFNFPAAAQPGQLCILFFGRWSKLEQTQPAGWTLVGESVSQIYETGPSLRAYAKVIDSSDILSGVTVDQGSNVYAQYMGFGLDIGGVSQALPLESTNSGYTDGARNWPPISADAGASLAVQFQFSRSNSSTRPESFGPVPGTWTEYDPTGAAGFDGGRIFAGYGVSEGSESYAFVSTTSASSQTFARLYLTIS